MLEHQLSSSLGNVNMNFIYHLEGGALTHYGCHPARDRTLMWYVLKS